MVSERQSRSQNPVDLAGQASSMHDADDGTGGEREWSVAWSTGEQPVDSAANAQIRHRTLTVAPNEEKVFLKKRGEEMI